jgi:hypothetical protein
MARQLLNVQVVKNLALLAVVLALFSGCTGTGGQRPTAGSNGKLYAVTGDNVAFFRFGPQQGNGPDRTLPRNTLVRLIRPSWGYSKVQLIEENQQGYVASEDIAIAPASLVVSTNATPSASPTGDQFDLNSTDPRLNAPAENLPSPDLPPAQDIAPAPSPADQ